ncbi:MAG: ATP-binding protein [Bacteroidota bacterium]
MDQVKSDHKVIVVYGARQTGKTTLVREILSQLPYRSLTINADQRKYLDVLSSRDARKIKSLAGDYELLFIDEAQRIPEAGLNLKIIHDEIPEIRIIVSGSSSLDLAAKISEPLTGRKVVFTLYPISNLELLGFQTPFEVKERLEEILVFGSYPEVIQSGTVNRKRKVLEEIGSSYLFKDIFELLDLRNREKLYDLLRLLSFQIGSEVSLNELSNSLKMNRETVENYLALLEETFIIFKLRGFSRNLRKEISKMNKYYFYDTGIRNYLVNNFNPLSQRNDVGQLWENFLLTERNKFLSDAGINTGKWFWRTYTGAELDYIEERGGELTGYEFKWNRKHFRPPRTWLDEYGGNVHLITRENYLAFITTENLTDHDYSSEPG